MNLVLLAVMLVGIWGIRPRRAEDPLSREQTTAVNGFFVLLVFLRHTVDYIDFGAWDGIFKTVNSRLGQLIVVPFLFYSGYGIMRSIAAKGSAYVSALPKNRLFKVWYHFAAAVALYALLGLLLHKGYSLKRVLLSFTGWDSIGNSNWYIFYTLVMYLLTWIAFRLFRSNHHAALALLTALAVGYILALRPIKDDWWYNTALVYPAGAACGLYREKLDNLLKSKVWYRILALVICGGGFLVCYKLRKNIWAYEAMCVFFALTVVAVTTLVKVGNPALAWLGKYTFEIYILQRLPMILLQGIFANQYLYLAVSFAATLALAAAFHWLLSRTDALLLRKLEVKP